MNLYKTFFFSLLLGVFLLGSTPAIVAMNNSVVPFTDQELNNFGNGVLSEPEYNAFIARIKINYKGYQDVINLPVFQSFASYQNNQFSNPDDTRDTVAVKILRGQKNYRAQQTQQSRSSQPPQAPSNWSITGLMGNALGIPNPVSWTQEAFSDNSHNQKVAQKIHAQIHDAFTQQFETACATTGAVSTTAINQLACNIIHKALNDYSPYWQSGATDPVAQQLQHGLLAAVTLAIKDLPVTYAAHDQDGLSKLHDTILAEIKTASSKFRKGAGLQAFGNIAQAAKNGLSSHMQDFNSQLGNTSPDQQRAQELEQAVLGLIHRNSSSMDRLKESIRHECQDLKYAWVNNEIPTQIEKELVQIITQQTPTITALARSAAPVAQTEKILKELAQNTFNGYTRGQLYQAIDTVRNTLKKEFGSETEGFQELWANNKPQHQAAQTLQDLVIRTVNESCDNTLVCDQDFKNDLIQDALFEFTQDIREQINLDAPQHKELPHVTLQTKLENNITQTITRFNQGRDQDDQLTPEELAKLKKQLHDTITTSFLPFTGGKGYQAIAQAKQTFASQWNDVEKTFKEKLSGETQEFENMWTSDKPEHQAAQVIQKNILTRMEQVLRSENAADAAIAALLDEVFTPALVETLNAHDSNLQAISSADKLKGQLSDNMLQLINMHPILRDIDGNILNEDDFKATQNMVLAAVKKTMLPQLGGKGHQAIAQAKQTFANQLSDIEKTFKEKLAGETQEFENMWTNDKPEHQAAQVIQKNILTRMEQVLRAAPAADTAVTALLDEVFTPALIETLNAHDSNLQAISSADRLRGQLSENILRTINMNPISRDADGNIRNEDNFEATQNMISASVKKTMLPHLGGKMVQMGTAFEDKMTGKLNDIQQKARRTLLTGLDIDPDNETSLFTAIENKFYGLGVKWGATVVGLVVAVPVLTFIGYFSSKYGVQYIYERFSNPEPLLFTESSERGFTRRWTEYILRRKDKVADLIYDQELEQRFDRITRSTINSFNDIQHGRANIFYEPVLMHGPPGTGKTAQAKRMIKQIYNETGGKMQWRVTNGSMLLNAGIDGINKMFEWLNKQPAACLFIDEADTLFPDRDEIAKSPERLEVVNHLLNLIGERSNKFMIIMTTNRLGAFDDAMERRIDNLVYVGLPEEDGRKKVLELYRDTMLLGKSRAPAGQIKQLVTWATHKAHEYYHLLMRKHDAFANTTDTNLSIETK